MLRTQDRLPVRSEYPVDSLVGGQGGRRHVNEPGRRGPFLPRGATARRRLTDQQREGVFEWLHRELPRKLNATERIDWDRRDRGQPRPGAVRGA